MTIVSESSGARIRNLAIRYECQSKHHDEMNMRKLERKKKSLLEKVMSFAIGRINDKIKLLETVMREHEAISMALYDYASILDRLVECRTRMIPHKCDTEIIDYILTGKKKHNNGR